MSDYQFTNSGEILIMLIIIYCLLKYFCNFNQIKLI